MRAPRDRGPRSPSCFVKDCMMEVLRGQSMRDMFFAPIRRASAPRLFD